MDLAGRGVRIVSEPGRLEREPEWIAGEDAQDNAAADLAMLQFLDDLEL